MNMFMCSLCVCIVTSWQVCVCHHKLQCLWPHQLDLLSHTHILPHCLCPSYSLFISFTFIERDIFGMCSWYVDVCAMPHKQVGGLKDVVMVFQLKRCVPRHRGCVHIKTLIQGKLCSSVDQHIQSQEECGKGSETQYHSLDWSSIWWFLRVMITSEKEKVYMRKGNLIDKRRETRRLLIINNILIVANYFPCSMSLCVCRFQLTLLLFVFTFL